MAKRNVRAKRVPSEINNVPMVKIPAKRGRKPGRPRRQEAKRSGPALLASIKSLSYPRLEQELQKLAELLKSAQSKSKFVRRSLAYLEREQRALAGQAREAKKYFTKIKNRGAQALENFPENTEEFLQQLKPVP